MIQRQTSRPLKHSRYSLTEKEKQQMFEQKFTFNII